MKVNVSLPNLMLVDEMKIAHRLEVEVEVKVGVKVEVKVGVLGGLKLGLQNLN